MDIYVDGGYSSSRDIMGYAFVVLDGEGNKIHSYFMSSEGGTNNRAEILAAMEACRWAKENDHKRFFLYSDSMYVIGTMTMGWKKNKNLDLWEEMDEVTKDLVIFWKHVKGHVGNQWNELCDALAVQATFIT